MIGTFAAELEHFARSVDIVDDNTFDRVRTLIYQYIKREFRDIHFELLHRNVTSNGHRREWLETFWSSEENKHVWPIHDAKDLSYHNAVTAAFATGSPLWLVSDDDENLRLSGAPLRDEWSSFPSLPPYMPSIAEAATAVVIPLTGRMALGAVILESTRRIEKTDVAATELTRLGRAISILFELYWVNQSQSKCTGAAIADLSELISKRRFPKTTLPHVFVAYPMRADKNIKSAIRQVLDEYSRRLEVTDWDRINEAGNVTAQVTREISESALGICYFSEPMKPTDGQSQRYQDNANVIFEAGMLHLRTSTSSADDDGQPHGWIPIREPEPSSPPPPFDFQNERILQVARDASGALLVDTFKDLLRSRLDRLLRSW
jgi:hypothetical protein